MRSCGLRWGAIVAFAMLASPASTMAQLADGVRLYEDADFRGALDAFDRALDGQLTSAELAQVYLVRAQVYFALDEQAEMMRDAARLAAVDPQHELGRAVPPQVREAFEQARELGAGLRLEGTVQPMPDGLRIDASVDGDPGDVVREVRIAGRAVGTREWISGNDGSLEVPSSGAVEWYVQVIGEGGALLRNEGSRDAPRVFGQVGAAAGETPAVILPPIEEPEDEGEGDGGVPVWLIVGGGVLGAALLVTAIVLIASSGGTTDDTQLSSPMFREP
jgi:hypothetical protein